MPAGTRSATALFNALTARVAIIEGVDRVPHDPVGVQVLDRAQIELALTGGVFGDVGQPQLVGPLGGETASDEVDMHRRAGLAVQSSLPGEHRPDPLRGAQPGHAVLTGGDALGGLIGNEPVPEGRAVTVDVRRGVYQVRVVPIPPRDRAFPPLVEPLLGEAQHRASHRGGDPVGGKVKDQRWGYLPLAGEHNFGLTSRPR